MLLFIYGTLKLNQKNNHILSNLNADFVFKTETIFKYPLFDIGDGFPYLQNDKNIGNIIQGELWRIDNSDLFKLNKFEGVPELYYSDYIEIKKYKEPVLTYFKTDKINLSNIKLLSYWSD